MHQTIRFLTDFNKLTCIISVKNRKVESTAGLYEGYELSQFSVSHRLFEEISTPRTLKAIWLRFRKRSRQAQGGGNRWIMEIKNGGVEDIRPKRWAPKSCDHCVREKRKYKNFDEKPLKRLHLVQFFIHCSNSIGAVVFTTAPMPDPNPNSLFLIISIKCIQLAPLSSKLIKLLSI